MAVSMLIGGEAVAASDGAVFERMNPVTGLLASHAPAATVQDARAAVAAVAAAASAFPAWSSLGPSVRRAMLMKAADALDARTPDLIALMADEIGATAGWASFNCFLAANMLREAAAMTTQVAGEVIPSDNPGSIALAVRKPAGAMRVARHIQAGICHINGSTVADEAQMPFGGLKGSGYGRFGGRYGVAEFTDVQWLTIETDPHYPF